MGRFAGALCRCCHPIPDDEIVAILSPGRGMAIHQIGCNNIRKLTREEPQRVLPMQWDDNPQGEFKASLRIELFKKCEVEINREKDKRGKKQHIEAKNTKKITT